jgi:hypothetical protein
MSEPNVVEQYWTGVASQLQVEADVFSRLVAHNGEIGRANEIALAQLVTSLLPSSVGVGTEIVIDSLGNRSKQMDIIVYERASQPQILAHSTQLLFPVETVHAAIEVKTTVDLAAITDTGEKAASLRALSPQGRQSKPLFALFGYAAAGSPVTCARELNKLPDDRRPDLACILDPGLFGGGGGVEVGLVPLHDQDASGERISNTWMKVPRETATGSMTVRGLSYPTSRLQVSARDRYVFEPGRALLLFAQALLDGLSSRSLTIDAGWLANYVPVIAREIVIPANPVVTTTTK